MEFYLEVLDYDSASAEVFQHFKLEFKGLDPIEDSSTYLRPLDSSSVETAPEGFTFVRSYEGYVYLGEGARLCTIYEYSAPDVIQTVYYEQEIDWPIMFRMDDDLLDIVVTAVLKETNIPGLLQTS